ncbi:NAD-dependent epimerase/dehydratase family protein [Dyadobacter sp. CY323]|uniref:NAD-dependent epimerase/dehydratase family protein n=1 Tax=Dyadobacter sp. CY323 TaxID=2907302 RepID=UPI001F1AB004|nr:NAD-dependent epimerase/dehydratase family protein [Dyadobacter sp. CY323]MCE6990968.1 NAD-dependent epimerase/dehydratase family protein [Dyadobacter sp. CY323]
MRVLVTGAAGFIGYHLVKKLIAAKVEVVGLDNINDYYSIELKHNRLRDCGIVINEEQIDYTNAEKTYRFLKIDLLDFDRLLELFEENAFDYVVNLAAQAGIRYSMENPRSYLQSNIEGFFNVLECCRLHKPKKLIYASSSSVYGLNSEQPFSTRQKTETPINIYAASKKSNELMAHAYSHLYDITTVGLRFFTVYGPWGRPDMAPFLFADAIQNGKPINVYNHGNMKRDFTYILDIVDGIYAVINTGLTENYQIFNIGNGQPVDLLHFIKCLENSFDKKAELNFKDIVPGDIVSTWADTEALEITTGYRSQTKIENGVTLFVDWYRNYYQC